MACWKTYARNIHEPVRVVTAFVYLLTEDGSVAVAVIRRDSDHKTRFTERAPGWGERNRQRAVAAV